MTDASDEPDRTSRSSPVATGAADTLVTVRLASVADAADVADIYGPYCKDDHVSFELEAPSADVMADRIETTMARLPWLVAVSGRGDAAVILGYAYAAQHRERAAYRWSVDVAVYVAAQWAGRGVGRHLYDRLFALLEAQGLHRAYAGVALPNDASVALHRSTGFEPVGTYREVGFKHGAWRDVQWWSRSLGGSSPNDQAGQPPAEPASLWDLPPDLLADLR